MERDGLLRPSTRLRGAWEALLPADAASHHACNLLPLANGDLLCAWFAGSREGQPDVSIVASRLPKGARGWTKAVRLSDDPTRSEQNPVLFQEGTGALHLFYTAQLFGNQGSAIVRHRVSRDSGATFGLVEDFFTTPGSFIRQRLVRSGGRILFPMYYSTFVPGAPPWGDDRSVVRIAASMEGPWEEVAVPASRGLVQMSIVELGDGFVAFFRSRRADAVHRSLCSGDPRLWSAPEPTDLPNNNSSIQAIRLKSGLLAMAFNRSQATKAQREANRDAGQAVWGVPRTPLTIASSSDGGRTWGAFLDLETDATQSDGSPVEFSYPSIAQEENGDITVAYTYNRYAIKCVRLNEETWKRRAAPR